MDKRIAAAGTQWSKHQAAYGDIHKPKPTAGDELVGCLKFLIVLFVLVPLLFIVAGMVWSAFNG